MSLIDYVDQPVAVRQHVACCLRRTPSSVRDRLSPLLPFLALPRRPLRVSHDPPPSLFPHRSRSQGPAIIGEMAAELAAWFLFHLPTVSAGCGSRRSLGVSCYQALILAAFSFGRLWGKDVEFVLSLLLR